MIYAKVSYYIRLRRLISQPKITVQGCVEFTRLDLSLPSGILLLREYTENKLSLLVRIKRRRYEAVFPGEELEPVSNFPGVNEGGTSCGRCMVQKVILGQN